MEDNYINKNTRSKLQLRFLLTEKIIVERESLAGQIFMTFFI